MGIFGSENKQVTPDENKEINNPGTQQNPNTNDQDLHDQDDANDDKGRVQEKSDDGDVESDEKTNATWYLYEDRLADNTAMPNGVIGYFRLVDGVLMHSPLLKDAEGEFSKYGERDRNVEEVVDINKWPHSKQERLSVIEEELLGKQ